VVFSVKQENTFCSQTKFLLVDLRSHEAGRHIPLKKNRDALYKHILVISQWHADRVVAQHVQHAQRLAHVDEPLRGIIVDKGLAERCRLDDISVARIKIQNSSW
jgi:hypothetical protein